MLFATNDNDVSIHDVGIRCLECELMTGQTMCFNCFALTLSNKQRLTLASEAVSFKPFMNYNFLYAQNFQKLLTCACFALETVSFVLCTNTHSLDSENIRDLTG